MILCAFRFFAYSRTVFAIYAVLLLIAVTLSRASFRLVGEFMQRQRSRAARVVIYGAGDAAGLVIREMLADGERRAALVGFIDDDPRKAGIRVAGYPVLGQLLGVDGPRACRVDRQRRFRRAPSARAPEQPRSARSIRSSSRLRIRFEPLVEGQSRRQSRLPCLADPFLSSRQRFRDPRLPQDQCHLSSPLPMMAVLAIAAVLAVAAAGVERLRLYVLTVTLGYWLVTTFARRVRAGRRRSAAGCASSTRAAIRARDTRRRSSCFGGGVAHGARRREVGRRADRPSFDASRGAGHRDRRRADRDFASGGIPRPDRDVRPESEMLRDIPKAGVPPGAIVEES